MDWLHDSPGLCAELPICEEKEGAPAKASGVDPGGETGVGAEPASPDVGPSLFVDPVPEAPPPARAFAAVAAPLLLLPVAAPPLLAPDDAAVPAPFARGSVKEPPLPALPPHAARSRESTRDDWRVRRFMPHLGPKWRATTMPIVPRRSLTRCTDVSRTILRIHVILWIPVGVRANAGGLSTPSHSSVIEPRDGQRPLTRGDRPGSGRGQYR